MKIVRILLLVLLTLALSVAATRVLVQLDLGQSYARAIYSFFNFFGIYGDEAVEDYYALSTLLLFMLVIGLLVLWASRAMTRGARRHV